jgi:excinuclease ABC subunit C
MDESLRRQLDGVPEKPGCYLYKDARGRVLYVGKAVNLRRRTFQYFQPKAELSPKNRALVAQIRSLETVVVGDEVEALILEENLIKKYRPRYNVLLRDDKRYPYLQLSLSEPYPRLRVTRRPHQAGDKYYGPFVHVGAMRETLRLVHRHLGLRQCDIEIDRRLPRPCLYYELHQCGAPCVAWGESREAYLEHVRQVQWLLEGREESLSAELRRRMEEASAAQNYEEAARWRDGLNALALVRRKQRIVLPDPKDVDVVALVERSTSGEGEAAGGPGGAIKVFFVRGGKLVDWQDCRLSHADDADAAEVLEAFLRQFYAGAALVPQEILLSHPIGEHSALRDWLSGKRGSRMEIRVPRRGEKLALVRLCEDNAREMLRESGAEARVLGERRSLPVAPGRDVEAGLERLRELLCLKAVPERIDGFDISHLQGSQTVASLVVMEGGRPARSQYRRFKVKSVEGVDDFASMAEVLERRYRRVRDEGGPWPDLIVIDGGKGQLGAALKALQGLGLAHLPVIGLAKRYEEIFVPGRVAGLRLGPRDPGRLLIQRLRDEAHRFAISFHRQLRSRALTHSALDEVPGVGPELKKRLLRTLGSVEGVRAASLEQLKAIEGVGPRLARRLKAALAPAAERKP